MARMDEMVSAALGRLGVRDIDMLNNDEYDFDNEEDEYCDIQSPPFDVSSILDQDLSDNPPGWYKNRPFFVDSDRVEEMAKRSPTESFLCMGVAPDVGQQVCLRVTLPYGGRGYLYGAITEVGPVPSDDQLRASGSPIFENPCPCTNPECELRTGSRHEILSVFGALHGQEFTGVVSLQSPYFQRKLRFASLPAYFQGENTKFKVTVVWDEKQREWIVKTISKIEA